MKKRDNRSNYTSEKPEKRDFLKKDAKSSTSRIPHNKKDATKSEISSPKKETPSTFKTPNYNLSQLPNQTDTTEGVRLNKFIANAGVCSRREADQLIADGKITVNGKVCTELGLKVTAKDTVRFENKVLSAERLVYVLLNKPKDHITTMDDPQERKTVMNLVKTACEERIFPVGRLDRNTTGLLLLTNDGDMTERLSHPSNNIKKIYQATLDKPITQADFDAISQGLNLEDGFIKVDAIEVSPYDASVIGIEIHSGKNRIVRRIFEHLKYEVVKLDRTAYAGLTKKNLTRGKWRFLTEKEVIRLKQIGNSPKSKAPKKTK